MSLGDFWLQSNSNSKGKKFSLKDLQSLKPDDIAKNPKLQKLITLFDSDGSGNLELNELQSVFSDLKSAAKDDILSDSELGLYLSDKFKDKDIKVEDVKELLNAVSSKELQVLNYTDLDGNNITDKYENGEIAERTITSQDDKGNKTEVNIFYENKKPVKQLQIVNNKIVATISYDYSKDPQNPTTTTIFKNKDGIVEEVNTPQKRTLTLYKTDSIDDFDKTKNHRLQQVVVTDKAQYVAEYDGKGNTLIIVQNSETPELIAQKFGIKLSDLIKVNKGLTRNTTLQAGQKLVVPTELNADNKVMKPRKSEGEVKQKAAQHAFGKVYDKIFASAIDEYTIKAENAGKDVYEYAEKYLIKHGAKKTDANFNARKNDLANELIALNGRDAKYTAGSKIKYIKKTLNQSTINQLKDAGMTPSQENQLFFARFNYLTPQQQTNVIEVLKHCKAKGITDPQKINAEILRYYPEIQMFETDKKVLQKPTKAMARSYMAHYLLEQIDAIIAMYNQTATTDQSLWTLGTGLIVELQDLLHISTKFINDNLGTCIAEGDSRVNLGSMLYRIRQECLNLCVLADMEEKNKDESFDKKKNIPGWEGSQFDKTFNALFYGKSMNYDAVITYLQAVQEFQKAPEKDRNNKNSQAYKKIEAATNKLNQQLPGFQDIAKRIEGWAGGTQIVGGLTDLGVQVAMLYLSGGGSAIARSSMYVGNATRYSVGAGMSRMAASRFGSTAAGRLLVKDGTQFITREGSAILASMVTSSAETAAFFQGTKVLGALEDGNVTGEEAAIINEGFEGLFKFGMVGSALAGPLGAKASELTSKLLNSEKAIASTMKLAIEGKGTTLDKVLKALCENSNAVSKITEFGTSFSINAGYMAVADNTGYGEAMGNLAQMDAVSKLVVAMLGGKNTAFLTPQKVQQIKTSLAGYEVKLSVYKGQKIYEVTDKSGAKTRLANEQELFMFIVDREVAELTRPNAAAARTEAWDRFNVTIEQNEELADNNVLIQLRSTIDQELAASESQINQIKEQLGIKGDLKLELQNPEAVSQTFGDDLHLRLTDKENNISFKFDKKTGKLIAILTPNEAYNVQNGTFVRTHMEKEFRAEDIMPDNITEVQRRINSTPTYMDIYVSKDGKQISHEEFIESKVIGEFEIYNTDPNGKKFKVGLAELMPDGGKYVEKTLTSLDGTKTDYVYKDDAVGNRFLYYKITDSNGKVLFETTKKYKVLSENHYQTTTNGEYYDVEILEDKIVVTKLDNAKNKTSEKIEYKIEDFTEEDYAEITERAERSVSWGREERRKENITNMLNEFGIGNTVDRKILPMLKQLSGEEWLKLSNSGARLLIGAEEGKRNAGSIGGIIKLSDGLANLLAVFEHEAGHEVFHHLRLYGDAELKKIYEEEKAAYTSTFTDDCSLSIAYFLRNNHDKTNRGINETVAETNLLTNMHQQENSIQARTSLLQHYFPRTLAHIANKLNYATTRAAIDTHIDANGRLEKGYIIDERSNQPIEVDTENLQIQKQSAADGRMGFVNITDKFGNNLGYVNYNLVEIDGQKSLHFEGLVSNVEGAGIGSRLIKELTLISRDLGAEGRLTATASPMTNRGGKLTNIEFYYKLGFKAVNPDVDAEIKGYIERGEEVPLQLNIFTEIELGPKFAKVDKNLTRTDIVEKLQQIGFSEEDIQIIKEKASNVDGALALIDLLSSTTYKNNAKKLLTDEFFEQVNSTRFDYTKLTLEELNKMADNLAGRHSVDELSQYLFRDFVRGSETMEDVSVRMEILDKIKILEDELCNSIDITDSWTLRPEYYKEASAETIIFTAKVAKALGNKTVYPVDFKSYAEIKEYTEQDIADIAELSEHVKLISFYNKTSLAELVGIKNLFDSERKADIRRICEIIENTQAGKLTENSFRRLMRGEVKDAELFAQILKNRKENNNASSQEAIPQIINLIEKYPDYKQDLIDISDYSSRINDFNKIIELWQNNPEEKDVIKQLVIAKRNINQIEVVLPLLNTSDRAEVIKIVLSKEIQFKTAEDILNIIKSNSNNSKDTPIAPTQTESTQSISRRDFLRNGGLSLFHRKENLPSTITPKEVVKLMQDNEYTRYYGIGDDTAAELYNKNPQLFIKLIRKFDQYGDKKYSKYSLEEISDFIDFAETHPKAFEMLFDLEYYEKYSQKYYSRFSFEDIKKLTNLAETNPEKLNYYLNIRNGLLRTEDILIIQELEAENAELLKTLLESKYKTYLIDDESFRFSINDIKELFAQQKENPELFEEILNKKINDQYRFLYKDDIITAIELSKTDYELFKELSFMEEPHFSKKNKMQARFRISDLNKLIKKYPPEEKEFLMTLIRSRSIVLGKEEYEYLPDTIIMIMECYEKNPELTVKIQQAGFTNEKGIFKHSVHSEENFKFLFEAGEKNEALALELANQTWIKGGELPVLTQRFYANDIADIINSMDVPPVSKQIQRLLNEKYITDKGEISYLFKGDDIHKYAWMSYSNPEEFEIIDKLLQTKVTVNGEKVCPFNSNGIKSMLKIKSEAPDMFNIIMSSRALQILIGDFYGLSVVRDYKEIFENPAICEFIIKNMPEDAYSAKVTRKYQNDVYELRVQTSSGEKIFVYEPKNMLPTETPRTEHIRTNDGITQVKHTFADGSYIVEKIKTTKIDDTERPITQMKTLYDSNGVQVRSEVLTPSDKMPGEYTINVYERGLNQQMKKQEVGIVRLYGSKKEGNKVERHLEVNGITTDQVRISGPKGHSSSYIVKDAEGNLLCSRERRFRIVDENMTQSIIDNNKYIMEWSDDASNVRITQLDERGRTLRVEEMDLSVVDTELLPLVKQLPGDMLFDIKDMGLKLKITDAEFSKNNASFGGINVDMIEMSRELMNNMFVFVHELGHAIDHLKLGNLNSDPQLLQIYYEELELYKSKTTDAEGRTIDYFTTLEHKNENNSLTEVIAEANAILSGFSISSDKSIQMRSVILEQHFPKTIAYIAKNINRPATAEEIASSRENLKLKINSNIMAKDHLDVPERIAEVSTNIQGNNIDINELKNTIRADLTRNGSYREDRIEDLLKKCGDDKQVLSNLNKLSEAGYGGQFFDDVIKYLSIPENILDELLTMFAPEGEKLGYDIYSLMAKMFSAEGLKDNYSEIFDTMKYLSAQRKEKGFERPSAREIADIINTCGTDRARANAFVEYLNLDKTKYAKLSVKSISEFIDFVYPNSTSDVHNEILHILEVTPEQLHANENTVLDGYYIKTILKENYTKEQINIIKNILYDKYLIGISMGNAVSVAKCLDFNQDLINLFKELYSTDLHPKSMFDRRKLDTNIIRAIVQTYRDADIIRTIKFLLENDATLFDHSSKKLQEYNFLDGSVNREDLIRIREYLELIKDNTDLKAHINFSFVKNEKDFELIKSYLAENKNITYEEMKSKLNYDRLHDKVKRIEGEELKKLAIDIAALDNNHRLDNIIPKIEEISIKIDNIEDDFVNIEIQKLLNECAENVKIRNIYFDYQSNIERINMYLDIYNTFTSRYEYIGTKREPTGRREYFNYVSKHAKGFDKDNTGKFIASAEERFNSSVDENIARDFSIEGRIERLKYYAEMFPADKMINYFYKEYYLREVPEILRQKYAYISDVYKVKLFLSADNIEQTMTSLEFVEAELEEWEQKSSGQVKFPPVLDLSLINKDYVDDKSAYGQSASAGSCGFRRISIAGMSNLVYALRHELTHYNEEPVIIGFDINDIMPHKIVDGVEVPDFENCKFKEEFLRAGISPNHIQYAYNSPSEFIAVASEGDMSKYSIEFKKILIAFGMPKWELDLELNNQQIKKNLELIPAIDYLEEFARNNLNIEDSNGNQVDLTQNHDALNALLAIYGKCVEAAKNVSMELKSRGVPNDPKKLFEHVIFSEDRYEILKDWDYVERILTDKVDRDDSKAQENPEFTIKKQEVLNTIRKSKSQYSQISAESVTPENIEVIEYVLKDEQLKNNYQVLSMLKSIDNPIKRQFALGFLRETKEKIQNYDNGLQTVIESIDSQEKAEAYLIITKALLEHGLTQSNKGYMSRILLSTESIEGANARAQVMSILERLYPEDNPKVFKMIDSFGEKSIELYNILKYLPTDKSKTTRKIYTDLINMLKNIESQCTKVDDYLESLSISVYNLTETTQINPKPYVYKGQKTKVTEEQIKQAINDMLELCDKEAKNIHNSINKLKLNKIGKCSEYTITPGELSDAIEKYVHNHPQAPIEEAVASIKNAYMVDTVLEPQDFTQNPQVKTLMGLGSVDLAIRRAATLQSEPVVDKVKSIIEAQAEGQSEYNITCITNYVSKGGIPYLSDSQISEIKQYASEKGITIEIIERVDTGEEALAQKANSAGRSDGYTALHINLVSKDGKTVEWRLRSEKIKDLAEGVSNSRYNISEAARDAYNRYLSDYYAYLRKSELGFGSVEPLLSDYETDKLKFREKDNANYIIKSSFAARAFDEGTMKHIDAYEYTEFDMDTIRNLRAKYSRKNWFEKMLSAGKQDKTPRIPQSLIDFISRYDAKEQIDSKTGCHINAVINEYLKYPEIYELKERCFRREEGIPKCIIELVTQNKRSELYEDQTGRLINDILKDYLEYPDAYNIRDVIYNNAEGAEKIPERIIELVRNNPKYSANDNTIGADINAVISDWLSNPQCFEFKTKIRNNDNMNSGKPIASPSLKAVKVNDKNRIAKIAAAWGEPMPTEMARPSDGIPEVLKEFINANPEGAVFDRMTEVKINNVVEEYLANPKEFSFNECMRKQVLTKIKDSFGSEFAQLAESKFVTKEDNTTETLNYTDLTDLRKIAAIDLELAKFIINEAEYINGDYTSIPHYYYSMTLELLYKYPLNNVKTLLMKWKLNTGTADGVLEDFSDLIPKVDKELKHIYEKNSNIKFYDVTYISRSAGINNQFCLLASDGNTYKFDKKTGKLLASIIKEGEEIFYNEENGTISQTSVSVESRNVVSSRENSVPVKLSQPFISNTETIVYAKDGQLFSHQEFIESEIKGEYEIYDYSPDGKLYKIGLAEISANGEKSVEKTLKSLGGTKTDYVYHDDPKGNRYLYYKVTSPEGTVLHETRKAFKVIDDNHFISVTNNQAYDIEFFDDKVVIFRLDENNNKTSEKVEYKIIDYTPHETKKEILRLREKLYSVARRKNVDLNDMSNTNIPKIYEVYRELYKEMGHNKAIDRRLLPLAKQISGEEWFKLDNAEMLILGYHHGNLGMELNAAAVGDVGVSIGTETVNYLSVVEHEFGHIAFEKLKLHEDTELRKIYEREKNSLIETFGEKFISIVEYFIDDTKDNTGYRGLNETAAETNLITNMHSQYPLLSTRTVVLQQYFPNTLAYIANKFAEFEKIKKSE